MINSNRLARLVQKIHDHPWLGLPARVTYYLLRRLFVAKHLVDRNAITIMPSHEKRNFILNAGTHYGCKYFVETGTYYGATVAFMSQYFSRCYTIELDEALAARAAQLLPTLGDIRPYQASSIDALPQVMAELDGKALFWLDAHGSTLPKTPILQELEIILDGRAADHVILIDDARAFIGFNGYPTIKKLCATVAKLAPDYEVRHMNDIFIVAKMSM